MSANNTVETNQSTLYCSSEYHLLQLNSPTAMAIYTLSLRIAADTQRFSVSTQTLADYFKVRRATVSEALGLLVDKGWYEKLSADPGRSAVYRPIYHNEWEESHLGLCIEKLAYPWSGQGDELGQRLYIEADQRFKIYPNILAGLRNTKHDDARIILSFQTFWKTDSKKPRMWKRFAEYLRKQPLRQAA